ncbi:MAG: septum formation initiator family protein [Flavobacteriaceae bacterium]
MKTLKNIWNAPWVRRLTNIYVLVSVVFVLWMLFFDTNSLRIYWSLNNKVKELEKQKQSLIQEIKADQAFIQRMKDTTSMERFGREKYFLKKNNEDIFIIEFQDSLSVE